MAGDSYVDPDRKAQIIVLLLLLLAAAALALNEPMANWITPSDTAPLEKQEAGARLLIMVALGTSVVAFGLGVFCVAYFVRLGYRALKLRIFPPPGTMVIVRTRVRSDKDAMLMGLGSILFAVAALFPVTLVSYAIWLLITAL